MKGSIKEFLVNISLGHLGVLVVVCRRSRRLLCLYRKSWDLSFLHDPYRDVSQESCYDFLRCPGIPIVRCHHHLKSTEVPKGPKEII